MMYSGIFNQMTYLDINTDEMLGAASSRTGDDVPELGNDDRVHSKALSKLCCVHPAKAEDFARKHLNGRR